MDNEQPMRQDGSSKKQFNKKSYGKGGGKNSGKSGGKQNRNRKKNGRPISGWVILDKPFEMGSTDAVARIKRLFGADKAGHAGTLDPLASGMLPIALGDATKTVPYVTDGTKVYQFDVRWGGQTNTDDLEGTMVETSDKRPSQADIEAIISDYMGVISQIPPQFSAVKINGERAYDVARSGETVVIEPREVEILSLTILKHTTDETTFECVCGKGTYVRSLARDMGRQLSCFGHISALRRTEVFPFNEADLVSLEALERAQKDGFDALDAAREAHGLTGEDGAEKYLPIGVRLPNRFAPIDEYLVPPTAALESLIEIPLQGETARRVRLGNSVILSGNIADQGDFDAETDVFATESGRLLAIGRVEHATFHPKRVFN